jgi:hypothetical protein
MLKRAPAWIQDLSWEELDQFFVNVFQEINESHLAKNGSKATSRVVYDYLNSRWVDRERAFATLDSVS